MCFKKSYLLLSIVTLAGFSWGFQSSARLSEVGFSSPVIRLPEHFKISTLVEGVPGARSMTVTPSGVVFVAARNERKVYAVVSIYRNSPRVLTIAEGLEFPNGVAFKNGDLFVAETHRILVFKNIEYYLSRRDSRLPAYEVISDDFPDPPLDPRYPTGTIHGWKYLKFGPDGWLYVSVGSPCNVCMSDDQRFATISRLKPVKNAKIETVAKGVRNSLGFDWHPETQDLWFTDNGRDLLGDDTPPDELNRLHTNGENFGFPYCFGRSVLDPEFGVAHSCSEFTAPIVEIPAHVAAIGMHFYRGSMFPEKYKGAAFIAEHGSWNRSAPSGYRLSVVTATTKIHPLYEVFADGWLNGTSVSGRPADVTELRDGSLLLSDEQAGVIYRITYDENSH